MFGNRFAQPSDPADLDLEAFAKALDAGEVTVVDVREPHEFAAGRIPGSLNLPMSRFDPGELPSGKAVVLICRSGNRSRNALAQARAAGRDDLRHFPGGMLQWGEFGGDLEV